MTVRHHWQESHLDRLSVTRTYKVQNQKNKIVAEQVVVMEYTAPNTETFTSSSAKGSGFVLHHIFQRLMENEKKRLRANKDRDSLISPENYTLEIVGTEVIGGSNCSVVHAIPKRKETDLFEGRIWIDNQDFAIVKIVGHLAKNPSFWVKRVDFVRDYQKIRGFWLVSSEKAISDRQNIRQGDPDRRLPELCRQWIGNASASFQQCGARRSEIVRTAQPLRCP